MSTRRAALCSAAALLAACTSGTTPTTSIPGTTTRPAPETTITATTDAPVPPSPPPPAVVTVSMSVCNRAELQVISLDTSTVAEPRRLLAGARVAVAVEAGTIIVGERHDDDGPIVIGASSVAAEDAAGGRIWTFRPKARSVRLEAVVAGETVILEEYTLEFIDDIGTTTDRRVVGLDLESGTERWATNGSVQIVTGAGTVVLDDGRIVDVATGVETARLTPRLDRRFRFVDMGTVLVGTAENRVYAADPHTGIVSEIEIDDRLRRVIGTDGATVVVLTAERRNPRIARYHARAFDIATGEERWHVEVHRAARDGRGWVLGALVYLPDAPRDFFAVDIESGARHETPVLDDIAPRRLVPSTGGATIVTTERRVVGIDTDGSARWDVTLSHRPEVIVSEGPLIGFARTRNPGKLTVIDTNSGDVVWTGMTNLRIDSLSIAGTDVLAVGCS